MPYSKEGGVVQSSFDRELPPINLTHCKGSHESNQDTVDAPGIHLLSLYLGSRMVLHKI